MSAELDRSELRRTPLRRARPVTRAKSKACALVAANRTTSGCVDSQPDACTITYLTRIRAIPTSTTLRYFKALLSEKTTNGSDCPIPAVGHGHEPSQLHRHQDGESRMAFAGTTRPVLLALRPVRSVPNGCLGRRTH